MDSDKIKDLLTKLKDGQIEVDYVMDQLRDLPFEDIDFARLDHHRSLRQGLPEVVFCQNKTVDQAIEILNRLWKKQDKVLATRVSKEMAASIQKEIPKANYNANSKLLYLCKTELQSFSENSPYILVLTAGTSDQPVAEEAAQTLEFLDDHVKRSYDIGVAGIHRLFAQKEKLLNAEIIICIAGMEGALASVVAGLVSCPLVAVPTSVGYGASFNGIAPLLTMLNSCAPGVAVVNIDNGFGAAVYAHLIMKKILNKGTK